MALPMQTSIAQLPYNTRKICETLLTAKTTETKVLCDLKENQV